ncbi:MAG: extracellular solute-binding protein [Bdellovibrionaceae bacterium]|nr:extracellular solute-binding protein [Pseudobdellovibrionaceae bacterium]
MNFILLLSSLFLSIPSFADVVLYTDRPTARMQVVADMYAKAGGDVIQINELKPAEILLKLQTDGAASPADVIFVKDAVYLQDYATKNVFAPMASQIIKNNVESSLKSNQNLWTFITVRARTLVYESSIDVSTINSYEDLAKNQWAGSLCLRTSQSSYNEALVAGLIHSYGAAKARQIVQGYLDNRAQPIVYKDDTTILKSIANGECAFGIANSYYLGLLLNQEPNLPLSIKFLNMKSGGTHINGTGAGVAVNSKQKDKATKFIEFMLSDEVQLYLAAEQMDYPAKKGLAPKTLIKNFGTFAKDAANWSAIGTKVPDAKKLMKDLSYE